MNLTDFDASLTDFENNRLVRNSPAPVAHETRFRDYFEVILRARHQPVVYFEETQGPLAASDPQLTARLQPEQTYSRMTADLDGALRLRKLPPSGEQSLTKPNYRSARLVMHPSW